MRKFDTLVNGTVREHVVDVTQIESYKEITGGENNTLLSMKSGRDLYVHTSIEVFDHWFGVEDVREVGAGGSSTKQYRSCNPCQDGSCKKHNSR